MISGTQMTTSPPNPTNLMSCQIVCQGTPGCQYWNFDHQTKSCQHFTQKSESNTNEMSTSGSKHVKPNHEFQDQYCPISGLVQGDGDSSYEYQVNGVNTLSGCLAYCGQQTDVNAITVTVDFTVCYCEEKQFGISADSYLNAYIALFSPSLRIFWDNCNYED